MRCVFMITERFSSEVYCRTKIGERHRKHHRGNIRATFPFLRKLYLRSNTPYTQYFIRTWSSSLLHGYTHARPYNNARVRNIFNALSKYVVKRVHARNLYENKPIELCNRPAVGKNTYKHSNDKSNVHAYTCI